MVWLWDVSLVVWSIYLVLQQAHKWTDSSCQYADVRAYC